MFRSIIKDLYNVFSFKMPKYAVAKGKTIGIYDTWDECRKQTQGFAGAKFKKFDRLKDAEDFIKEYNGESSMVAQMPPAPQLPHVVSVENRDARIAQPVAKVSPSNPLLHEFNNRLTAVESKLSNLIDHVTNAFTDIKNRLEVLEEKKAVNQQLLLLETREAEQAANDTDNSRGRKRKADVAVAKKDASNNSGEGMDNEEDRLPDQKKTKLGKCTLLDEVDGSYGIDRGVLDNRGFLVNPFGAVVVYTDGACSNNGRPNAKAGIGVWFNANHSLNMSAAVRGRATNNNAEIQAATAAILQASKAGVRNLHIFTDSQFLINCITSWIYKWKRNNWMTAENKPVINKIELVELNNCIDQYMDSVVWTYVKGHSGDIGNSSADELARQGAREYKRFCVVQSCDGKIFDLKRLSTGSI